MRYILIFSIVLSAQHAFAQLNPNTNPMDSVSRSLWQRKIVNRIKEMENYTQMITDQSIATSQRYKALNLLMELFASDTTRIEVQRGDGQPIQRYLVSAYFNHLMLGKYDKVKIDYSQLKFTDNFQRSADGHYYISVVVTEETSGVSGGKTVMNSSTKKTVSFVLGSYQRVNSEGEALTDWELFFSDIRIIRTKVFAGEGAPLYSARKPEEKQRIISGVTISPKPDLSLKNISSPTTYFNVNFLDADFSYKKYRGDVDFTSDLFKGPVSFTYSQFSTVNFKNVTFSNRLLFDKSELKGPTYLTNCQFNGDVTFSGTDFSGDGYFLNDIFAGHADFSEAQFYKRIDLSDVTFGESADFSSLIINDSTIVVFNRTNLPLLLDFSNNLYFKKEINFLKANFDHELQYSDGIRKWHHINIFNTDVTRLKLDYQHFRVCFFNNQLPDQYIRFDDVRNEVIISGKHIALSDRNFTDRLLGDKKFRAYLFQLFPGCRYSIPDTFSQTLSEKYQQLSDDIELKKAPVIIAFLKMVLLEKRFPRRLTNEDIISIYERSLKNFEAQGQMESYRNLDIEYKEFKNKDSFIAHIWNGYGYHKEWVFYWVCIFLAAFTAVSFATIRFLNEKVYTVSFITTENISFRRGRGRPRGLRPGRRSVYGIRWPEFFGIFYFIIRRLWYAFVYTSVVFFLFSLKIENFKFQFKFWSVLGTIYVVTIYALGLTCLAYMANFVLQK